MRDSFVARWQATYGDKYPFQAKDGSLLAGFIKNHPHLVERWDEMVDRYFADAFWAENRHPLTGLATNPVKFSGAALRTRTAVARADGNDDELRSWYDNKTTGGAL